MSAFTQDGSRGSRAPFPHRFAVVVVVCLTTMLGLEVLVRVVRVRERRMIMLVIMVGRKVLERLRRFAPIVRDVVMRVGVLSGFMIVGLEVVVVHGCLLGSRATTFPYLNVDHA